MTRLDLGVLEGVPVGLQVGVVEPADQAAVLYRCLFFAAHRLTSTNV